MRVYFDEKNIASFFGSSSHTAFQDCLRMIKSQCDIYFTFPKEIFANPPYNLILNQLSSGRGISLKPQFIELFPPRPLKSNIHKDFNRDELTAVYLIDDEKIETVKSVGAVLIGAPGEEIDTLSKLFYDDYQYTISFTPKEDMPTWDVLSSVIQPCSDIIIIDRFLFAEQELIEYNLHSFLKVISNNSVEKKFNLVIFTDSVQQIRINGRIEQFEPDWSKIRSDIISYFRKINKRSAINVTIVASREIGEHDRSIFMNYANHSSGDSLNYYDSNGRIITNGRHYTIYSHGLRKNLDNGYSIIDDMQNVINKISSPQKKDAIFGDKKCHFLKFPD